MITMILNTVSIVVLLRKAYQFDYLRHTFLGYVNYVNSTVLQSLFLFEFNSFGDTVQVSNEIRRNAVCVYF